MLPCENIQGHSSGGAAGEVPTLLPVPLPAYETPRYCAGASLEKNKQVNTAITPEISKFNQNKSSLEFTFTFKMSGRASLVSEIQSSCSTYLSFYREDADTEILFRGEEESCL